MTVIFSVFTFPLVEFLRRLRIMKVANCAFFFATATAAFFFFNLLIPVFGFSKASELFPLVSSERGCVGHRFRIHVKDSEGFHDVE